MRAASWPEGQESVRSEYCPMSAAVRFTGWILLFFSFAILGWELYLLADTGKLVFASWGEFWFSLHPSSLNLYQAVVERYISSELWDRVLAPMLLWDAFMVFAVPGVVLASLPRVIQIFTKEEH
jgi:hypothetical protein